MNNVKLYRNVSDRMVGGVCGGLGVFLNIDPIFIRLLFVLLLFGTDFGFILYLLLWILIPEEGKSYGFKEESFGTKFRSIGEDIQGAVTQPHPQSGLILGISTSLNSAPSPCIALTPAHINSGIANLS